MSTEPSFIDTHVHFWDHSLEGFHWPWLEPGFSYRHVTGSHELDAPRYTAPEFREETCGAGVVGIVHVQAAGPMPDPDRETAWLEAMADEHGLPNAIVGSCDLRDEGAPELLRRHARYSRLRGVRDVRLKEVEPEQVAHAFDAIADLDLSVQLRFPPERFDQLGQLAARWPMVPLALSHGCLPLERTPETFATWRSELNRLASHENVYCKISAVAGASDPDWTLESIRPWILTCVETFGPQRCMFGMNWPIDRLVGSYHDILDAYRQVTAELGAEAQASVLHGTAQHFYGLVVSHD